MHYSRFDRFTLPFNILVISWVSIFGQREKRKQFHFLDNLLYQQFAIKKRTSSNSVRLT